MLKSLSTELKAAGFISQEQYDVIQLFRSKNPAESSLGPLLAVGDLNEQQVQSFIMQKTRAQAAPANLLDCLQRLKKEVCPLNSELLQHFEVIPLSWDEDKLELAVADPLNKTRMAQLEFLADRKITFRVATQSAVTKALQKFFPNYKVTSKPWEHLKSLTKVTGKKPASRPDSWHGASGIKAPARQTIAKPAPQSSAPRSEKQQISADYEAKANALLDEDVSDEVISPSQTPTSLTPEPVHKIDEIVSMDEVSPFQSAPSETPLDESTEFLGSDPASEIARLDDESFNANAIDPSNSPTVELDMTEMDEPMVDTGDLENDLFDSISGDEELSEDPVVGDDTSTDISSDLASEDHTSESFEESESYAGAPLPSEQDVAPQQTQDFAQQVSRLNLITARLAMKLNAENIADSLENNAKTLDQSLILALSEKNEEPHFFIANFPGNISTDRIREEISETIITQWNSSEQSVRPIEVQLGPYTSFKAAFATNKTHHACLMLPWAETNEDSQYIDDLLVRLTSKILERYEFN